MVTLVIFYWSHGTLVFVEYTTSFRKISKVGTYYPRFGSLYSLLSGKDQPSSRCLVLKSMWNSYRAVHWPYSTLYKGWGGVDQSSKHGERHLSINWSIGTHIKGWGKIQLLSHHKGLLFKICKEELSTMCHQKMIFPHQKFNHYWAMEMEKKVRNSQPVTEDMTFTASSPEPLARHQDVDTELKQWKIIFWEENYQKTRGQGWYFVSCREGQDFKSDYTFKYKKGVIWWGPQRSVWGTSQVC